MNRLTIGFDAKRIVANATGLGSYGRTLVNSLSAADSGCDLLLYAPSTGRDDLRSQVAEGPHTRFVYPDGHPCRLRRDWWRTRSITRDLLRDGVDVFHGLSGELPLGLRHTGIKGVVTIHDLIFMRHPEYYRSADVMIYKWKFRQACLNATRIIAISQRTRDDIVELGHVSPDRISIIYQSCSPRFSATPDPAAASEARRRYRLPDHYILSVGTIEPRKNVMLACEALLHLPDTSLVIVGRRTPYADKVEQYCRRHGLSHRVMMLSGVDDAMLAAIYQCADVFVYPSRYEGFGIPIIEAVQCGLPVVAAKGSCLEEAGGPDNLYVDPDNGAEMAEAIRQMMPGAEFRDSRIRRSREYVRRFERGDVARQVLDIYRSI